jgi:putative transposase
MPRRPRFVLPGAPHHVTQRGNNRQAVFFCDEDRRRYLQLLCQYSQRHDLRILGWCLMTNHVHLIAIPGTARSLALALGQAHSRYSLELNRKRSWIGHIWQNRFFSCPLEASHLLTALRYVDLNPVRAEMANHAWDWPWSSAGAHAMPHGCGELLDWPWRDLIRKARLGDWDAEDWRASLRCAESQEDLERLRRATRLGEPFGSEAFLRLLEAKAGRRLRVLPPGRPSDEKVRQTAAG